MSGEFRCPTCRAAWRSATPCPRCGTDLAPLMRAAVRAWELREAARRLLCADGQTSEVLGLAHAADRLHATARGTRLLVLALLEAGQFAEAGALLARVIEGEAAAPGRATGC